MKKTLLAMLMTVCHMAACTFFVSCGHDRHKRSSYVNDSIYTLDNIRTIIMTDPAKALAMLDTAESKKLIARHDMYGMKSVI